MCKHTYIYPFAHTQMWRGMERGREREKRGSGERGRGRGIRTTGSQELQPVCAMECYWRAVSEVSAGLYNWQLQRQKGLGRNEIVCKEKTGLSWDHLYWTATYRLAVPENRTKLTNQPDTLLRSNTTMKLVAGETHLYSTFLRFIYQSLCTSSGSYIKAKLSL